MSVVHGEDLLVGYRAASSYSMKDYSMRAHVPLILVSFFLSSCATLSENECLSADWHVIGYEDGMKGYSGERIGEHRRACADYGIVPNLNTYKLGLDEGLVGYCTPRNGYVKGKRGYKYTGVCPAHLEAGFIEGYEAGREIYFVNVEIDDLKRELHAKEERRNSIDDEIIEKEKVLFSGSAPEKKRRKMYEEIGELKEERGSLELRIDQVGDERREAERYLRVLYNHYSNYE